MDDGTKGRLAVLLSGRGSNFEALQRHAREADANYRIVVVVSDREHAPGLAKARQLGLPAFHLAPRS
jgi:phosphoribosylglycinamide formyltransferase-1